MRSVTGSLVTLISGAALLLIWAGFVEAFLSQYHEPILPYQIKIVFGFIELLALLMFLTFAGRGALLPSQGHSLHRSQISKDL